MKIPVLALMPGLCALLTGCGNDLCQASDSPPELVIGTGEVSYEPLQETIELVHGPQGGFHILIGLQARHLNADGLTGALITGTIGDQVAATAEPWMRMSCTDNGLDFAGIFLIYDRQPEELDGQLTHIVAQVTDLDGTLVEAEADVTIVDPLL